MHPAARWFLLLLVGFWLPEAAADNATDLGLTWIGQDALTAAPATPAVELPANSVIHLPPAMPSFNGGTRRFYRNDSEVPLELRWSGLFDDGTDGVGIAAFVEGAGARYWNWFFLGGTHPGGVTWRPKSLVVLPGDYVVEMSGGLSHVAASGWSIGVEPDAAQSGRLQVVRLSFHRGAGIAEQSKVVTSEFSLLPKVAQQLPSNSPPAGFAGTQVSPIANSTLLPNGGWLVQSLADRSLVPLGVWEIAKYGIRSGTIDEGRLIVQAWVYSTSLPEEMTDSVLPVHPSSLDPGENSVLTTLKAADALIRGGLGEFLRTLSTAQVARFWQGLPNTLLYGALPSILPPFTAVTLSGRPVSRWELVSGPGVISNDGAGRATLTALNDSGAIVVRAVVDAGLDELGTRWSANDTSNGILRIPVRRQVRVAAVPTAKVYDGAPLVVEVQTSGALLPGDAWQVDPGFVGPDAGTHTAVPRARIVGADGNLVLDTAGARLFDDRYRLQVVSGNATIDRRPAVVSAPDTARLYGEPNPTPTWLIDNPAPGETLAIGATAHTAGEQAMPGTYVATAGMRMTKADGTDSNANYLLTQTAALVHVVQRPLTIAVTAPPEREFDGLTGVAPPQLVSGSVPAFDELSLPVIAIPADAGEHTLIPSPALRRRAEGSDVGAAYTLTLRSAVARILPAEVSGEVAERWWDGSARLGENDVRVPWRVPRAPALAPQGTTTLRLTNADGSHAALAGEELLPDLYAVEATFQPANGNFRSASARASWYVRAPVVIEGRSAEILRDGATIAMNAAAPALHVLPSSVLNLQANPAEDHAWGESWEETTPTIWASEPAGLLTENQQRTPALSFTVPRQVRRMTLRANAYQLPPVVESLTLGGPAVTSAPEAPQLRAYLGRPGLVVRVAGRCRESPVAGFEVQWREPGAAEWPASENGPAWLPPAIQSSRAGEQATLDIGAQLGGVLVETPLVPLHAETAGEQLWTVRCRLRSASGRLSAWRELSVVGELPLINVPLRMRTLPPAGEAAAWFSASEERTVVLPVWLP